MNDSIINRENEIERLKLKLTSLKEKFKYLTKNKTDYKMVKEEMNILSKQIDNLEQRNNVIKGFYSI